MEDSRAASVPDTAASFDLLGESIMALVPSNKVVVLVESRSLIHARLLVAQTERNEAREKFQRAQNEVDSQIRALTIVEARLSVARDVEDLRCSRL